LQELKEKQKITPIGFAKHKHLPIILMTLAPRAFIPIAH
jgi:hypothetical protein